MFREGINIDPISFTNQTRVDLARKENKKIIFFPNFLVTPQIFYRLLFSRSVEILCGGYGISKTIAIIMYCHLYYPVHKFQYQAAHEKLRMAKTNEKSKKWE